MGGDFYRVFKIMLGLGLRKVLARQPMQVRQQTAFQNMRGGIAPVPHESPSLLGTSRMSSKHEEKKLIHEILFLLGKILLIISFPLFMLIFFRFILMKSISSDFFDLENLLKPHVHGTLMFFLGFSLYVVLIMGIQSSIRKNYFKSMTYPSPIFRKHLCL